LALDLVYKAERWIPSAVDWLTQLSRTRGAKAAGTLAIWGLSVDERIPIGNDLTLVAFDLTLASEIAVRGKGGGEAPPGWKVSVRSAQLIGGALEKRQANREKIGELNRIRNQAAHGGSLRDLSQKQKQAMADCPDLYRQLV
jgi:hypothetical protein